MYKKVNVVMLPTNEKAKIGEYVLGITNEEDPQRLFYDKKIQEPYNCSQTNYNLYFLSDEEIKEGDWCFNSYDNQIWKYKPSPCPLPYWGNKDTLTKVIATTDISLISINEQYFNVNKSRKSAVLEQKTLPQPFQEFIRQYIEEYNKGNVISEVDVEYDLWDKFTDVNDPNNHTTTTKKELKVNPDNTINIKPIKDNWSREEVKQLCKLAFKYHCDNSRTTSLPDKWIEENL